jgi:hypothetical protein
MKKALFMNIYSHRPFISRKKLKKGTVEYVQPTAWKGLSLLPISYIGKAIIDESLAMYFDPKFTLKKEFFVGGAFKFWIQISIPNLLIIYKRDMTFESGFSSQHYAIIEVEGYEKDIDNFLSNVVKKYKLLLFNELGFSDNKIIQTYKNHNNETIISTLKNGEYRG